MLLSNRLVRESLQGRQELDYVLQDRSGYDVRNGLIREPGGRKETGGRPQSLSHR